MIFLPNLFFTEISWNFIPEIETDFPSNWEIHQFFGSRSWFPWIPNLWHQKICGSNAKNNKKRWGIWMSGGDVNMGCVANLGQKDFRWKTESMSKAFWRYPNVGHCSYIYIYYYCMYYIMHQLAPNDVRLHCDCFSFGNMQAPNASSRVLKGWSMSFEGVWVDTRFFPPFLKQIISFWWNHPSCVLLQLCTVYW